MSFVRPLSLCIFAHYWDDLINGQALARCITDKYHETHPFQYLKIQ